MAGKATGRAVSSINAMLDAKMVAATTQGAAFGEQGASAFVERMTPSSQGCLITWAIGSYPFPHAEERNSWSHPEPLRYHQASQPNALRFGGLSSGYRDPSWL